MCYFKGKLLRLCLFAMLIYQDLRSVCYSAIGVAEVLKTSEFAESKCFIVDRRNDDDEYGLVLLSDIAKKVLARDR